MRLAQDDDACTWVDSGYTVQLSFDADHQPTFEIKETGERLHKTIDVRRAIDRRRAMTQQQQAKYDQERAQKALMARRIKLINEGLAEIERRRQASGGL